MSKSILNIEEIERRREALKLTQGQAAERAGFTHRQQWNNIASGRKATITLETLQRVAAALECSPRDLLANPLPPVVKPASKRAAKRRKRVAAAA